MHSKLFTSVFVVAALTRGLPITHAQDKSAEAGVETNVVYAMYSGLALLMDVYHPPKPNGHGIILISGSAWRAPLGHSNSSLKDRPDTQSRAKTFLDAGYTVFAMNHRGAPEFKHPAAQEDAQRAVRFVRTNAKRYRIRADRIGAFGISSGGHLALLLAVLDGVGVPDDPDPVARESAKVQCVVAWMPACDLLEGYDRIGPAPALYLGTLAGRSASSPETRLYREASPITHVGKDDPPTLLIHGDADVIVPIKHSELMEEALKKAGVTVKLIRLNGGVHGSGFRGEGLREEKSWPDYVGESVRWFDQHLQTK